MTDAEIRVGRRLARLMRVWKNKDAVAQKGEDNARLHGGWVAQDVVASFTAEGLDPFAYGCVGFDLTEKEETYEGLVWRDKTEMRPEEVRRIDIVEGQPVLKVSSVTRPHPVGTMKPVKNESGELVMVLTGERSPGGTDLLAPLLHFVPEREQVPETLTRMVPDRDAQGLQKRRLNVRPNELDAFVVAAFAADIESHALRLAALEPT